VEKHDFFLFSLLTRRFLASDYLNLDELLSDKDRKCRYLARQFARQNIAPIV
jgi:hypothetical protein